MIEKQCREDLEASIMLFIKHHNINSKEDIYQKASVLRDSLDLIAELYEDVLPIIELKNNKK